MRGIRLVIPMLVAALVPVVAAPLTASGAEPIVAAGTVYSGVYPNEWLFSAELDNFSSWAGARPTFAGNFHNVDESDTFPLNTYTKLEEAWEAQTTPWANLEIPATSAAIASGAYDADLATWGQAIEGWLDDGGGRSLIISPLAEMNGDWTVWGADPANFKLAFNRIQDVVEAQITDDSKVRWAFAPNGWSTPGYGGIAAYYPGDDRVDVIGLSTYNFGETLSYDGWEPVSVAVAPYVDEVVTTVSDSKPLFLAQVASSSDGGDKSGWIRDLFAYAADHENLIGVLWFNKD